MFKAFFIFMLSACAMAAAGDKYINNSNLDRDVVITVNKGGVQTEALTIQGSTGNLLDQTGSPVAAGTSSQIYFHGYYDTTTGCRWTVDAGVFTDFTADADCPAITAEIDNSSGGLNAADNDLPDLIYTTLPAGEYVLTVQFPIESEVVGTNTVSMSVTDGVTSSHNADVIYNATSNYLVLTRSITAAFSYGSAGARTFKLQGDRSSSPIVMDLGQQNTRVTFTLLKMN